MNAKFLGIGLLALTAVGAGAAYFVRAEPQPVEAPRALASEPPVPAAAPAPFAATTVPVRTAADEPGKTVAARPAATREAKSPLDAQLDAQPAPRASAPEPAAAVEPPPAVVPSAPPVVATLEPQQDVQKPRYEEVTIAADAVLGVTMDSTISSETAKIEDRVNARVSRDVLVDGKIAVPAGARLEGVVTDVTRGGKFKERPRIGVAFHTLTLADGTKLALSTDTVFRDGEAPADVKAKVGGSGVVGAILGAMIGGKKGAVLGGAAGAAGGAAVVAAGNRAEVSLVSGSSLTVRLKQPITVLVER